MIDEILKIDHVEKVFHIKNKDVAALHDIDFSIRKGEFVSIVGASGCGKSTLLRMIAGLEKPSSGNVTLHGKTIEKPSVNVGMVFQESRLFPWWSVSKNIGYGLHQKLSVNEKSDLIAKHIELVGLSGFEQALPKQLSGGMQQRAAIARGLINNPEVLLMDEPFGALDAITRITMQNETLRIWQADRKTVVLVTHDIDEAIYLGDKIIVLSSRPGTVKRVINVDLPRPRDRSSPDFIRIRREVYREFFEEASFVDNIEYYL